MFGTSRTPSRSTPIAGVTFLPLDVTDDASAVACAEAVLAQTGRLDVLVNNAGIVVGGAVEEVTIEEALRHEAAHLGVRVALVEPGFYQSDLVAEAAITTREIDDYREVKRRVLGRLQQLERESDPPTAVADLAPRLVCAPRPALHNPIGKEKIFVYLKRLLPEGLWEPQAKKFWKVTA